MIHLKSNQNQLYKPTCRAAIYARYSSDMQNPDSADDQIYRIRHYVDKGLLRLIKFPTNEYKVVFQDEWILKDEAETGKVADRHGYELLLQGIKSDKFDAIFVDDLSRLARSLGDQIHLYELIRFKEIELYSLCESISSESANAKMFFQIKGVVNELSNDIHAKRTKRGQEARVLKGYSAGDICYGYGSKATQTRLSGGRVIPSHYEIFVNPEQAKVINLIFDLKIKGMGHSAIANHLNFKKIPSTDRGKKITGRTCNWGPTLVRKILLNGKYIGVWNWGKETRVKNPETHKDVRREKPRHQWMQHLEGKEIREDLVIISSEKWKKVEEIMIKTQNIYRNSQDKAQAMRDSKMIATKSKALLAGILHCADCGTVMVQVVGGYFGCYMAHRKDKTRCSNKRLLSRKKVDAKVSEVTKQILLTPEHLDNAAKTLNDMIKSRLKASPEEIKMLERKKIEISTEINNLLKFIMTHGDVSPTVKETMEAKEKELQYINSRIQSLKVAKVDKLLVTPYSLRARYEKLADYFETDPIMANAALRKLIPSGLKCRPGNDKNVKNCNQHNSLWNLEGAILVGAEGGFSNLVVGGGGGS